MTSRKREGPTHTKAGFDHDYQLSIPAGFGEDIVPLETLLNHTSSPVLVWSRFWAPYQNPGQNSSPLGLVPFLVNLGHLQPFDKISCAARASAVLRGLLRRV